MYIIPFAGETELMQIFLTLTVTHRMCHSKTVQAALTFKQDNVIQTYTVIVEIPAFTWFQ